ncbi:MAG: hypothetical protein WC412_02030 [Candidatus Omnitrophota bacterium]|jgi:glucan phosphoethanolaminetransferase (alkaline phosphatase superfamily)
MENSALLARFIGPYIIVIATGLLFNQKRFRQIMEDFSKNPALIFVTGLLTFVVGLAIVLSHNIWSGDWRLIITLFGWIALIKGAWLIILPGALDKTMKLYTENFKFVLIPWSVMLLLGIFLTVKGYIQ